MTITHGQFKVGATYGGLALLSALGIPSPLNSIPSYSRPTEVADATVKNNGWLRCTWGWGFLKTPQYTALRLKFPLQSGSIYISTPIDDLSWVNYSCTYRFQTPLPESVAEKRFGIRIEFVNMVVATS